MKYKYGKPIPPFDEVLKEAVKIYAFYAYAIIYFGTEETPTNTLLFDPANFSLKVFDNPVAEKVFKPIAKLDRLDEITPAGEFSPTYGDEQYLADFGDKIAARIVDRLKVEYNAAVESPI